MPFWDKSENINNILDYLMHKKLFMGYVNTVLFLFIIQISQKNGQNSWLLHPFVCFLPQSIVISPISLLKQPSQRFATTSELTNWLLRLLHVWHVCSVLLLTAHPSEYAPLIQSFSHSVTHSVSQQTLIFCSSECVWMIICF